MNEETGQVATDQFYRRLVRTAPVGIYQTSIDGEVLFANQALAEIFHYDSADAMVGENVREFYAAANDRAAFLNELETTGDVTNFETRMVTADGGSIDVLISGSLFEDRIMGTVFDITVRRDRIQRLQRMSRAIEATGHTVLMTDADGTIEYVNPAFEEITGYSADEALGNTPRILKSGEMPDGYYEDLWETLLDGEVWEEVIINQRKNGDRYHAHQTIAPVIDPDGEIEAFVAIQTDITERIDAEQERERQHEHLRRTERLAGVGGWEYEPATETLHWTDGTRRIFDVADYYEPTLDDAIGFYHPDDRDRIRTAFTNCLEKGTSYSLDLQIVTDQGRQRWVHTRGERVEVNGATKIFGAIQDISEHKTDEQRLMVLNRVLRHNLKNEMNVVHGYAETLRDQLPPESENYFDNIAESAERLLALADKSRRFNEVLEFDYSTGPVAIRPTIEDLCEHYRAEYPAAAIETDLEEVSVPGNESGLRILFEELLDNALKHNDKPTPEVHVTVTRASEQRVMISIGDNGPGLPETERSVLSEGEETALLHSSGMGLWIVNWMVTKLSGGIQSVAVDDSGTTISISLPRVTPDGAT